MRQRRIEVEAWNPDWSDRFVQTRAALMQIWPEALSIHHIGSTAVPGLAAKPTIDVLVVLPGGVGIEARYPGMTAAGYDCRGECLDAPQPGTPGRFYFVLREGVVHLTHVHVVHSNHFEIDQLLAVRDYLRAEPDARDAYGTLKLELANEHRFDNLGYMRGKDAAVRALIEAALAWRT